MQINNFCVVLNKLLVIFWGTFNLRTFVQRTYISYNIFGEEPLSVIKVFYQGNFAGELM